MHSCLYQGKVSHARYSPKPHKFSYRMFYTYLDLDELDRVFAKRWLWSTKRAALARFCRGDHAGAADTSLKDFILDFAEQKAGVRPGGAVRLLTQLRYFGYVFNPVSFYYCFDAADENVEVIVAEVNNTPWAEQHLYVILRDEKLSESKSLIELDKEFHVSPFMPMDIKYRWALSDPDENLDVQMQNYQDEQKVFQAKLRLSKIPMTARSCALALARYPLMTFKIIGAIYWQAFRLYLKGTPLFVNPSKQDHPKGGADPANTL